MQWKLPGLCLLLTGAHTLAIAATPQADINAVSAAWDRYATLSSQNDPDSVALLSRDSLAHFGFLRDAALYASAEQLRRLPSADRLTVYLLRASQPPTALKAMDDEAVARLCMRQGWSGVRKGGDGEPAIHVSRVTVLDERAVTEVAPPTETRYQFGPDLVREQGQWKYRYLSMVPDASEAIENSIRQSGATSTQVIEYTIANLLGDRQASPALATLDRTSEDSPAQRARLSERWPAYETAYRYRFQALQAKAEDGDPLASYLVGLLMVDGEAPNYIKPDPARGWTYLDQASQHGNADAAWRMFGHLMEDPKQYTDANLQQAATHLQRAAAAGNPGAMLALGTFYFEGVGGLAQDCVQAAEWQARAEEAGIPQARNDLVWTLATCPVPAQRDPARAVGLAHYMMEQRDTLDSSALDTVAAALAANGQFREAVDYQKQAIAKLEAPADAEPGDAKAMEATRHRMQARLQGYGRGHDYMQDYNTFELLQAGEYGNHE